MSEYRLMIADNNEEIREYVAEFLRDQGYDVVVASTYAEAKRILQFERLHLAILDLRLKDDDDQKDRSGLRLAKKVARGLPKIIWTAYPIHEDVRDALKPDSFNLPPAVDFMDKARGYAALAGAIDEALSKHARINWGLTISWEGSQSLEQLTQKIIERSEFKFWNQRIAELEDLLRKLFYECEHMTVGQALLEDDRHVIVPIYTFRSNKQAEQYIVSMGVQSVAKEETRRYETAVPQSIRTHKISLINTAETNHFMATAYAFIGGNLEKAQSLETYFERNSAAKLHTVIDDLFQTNLIRWYQRARQSKSTDETFRYFKERVLDGFDFDRLNQIVQKICEQANDLGVFQLSCFDHQLIVRDEARTEWNFHHPLALFDNNPLDEKTAVYWSQIHGSLCRNTVLVDDKTNTWVINFLHAGTGPMVNDFTCLESSIKYYLLQIDSLSNRLEIEKAFVEAKSFEPTHSAGNGSAQGGKVFEMVRAIRQQAAFEGGCDWQSYQLGLYFASLAFISRFDMSRKYYLRRAILPFIHALCSAAMLAKQLSKNGTPDLPPEAYSGLWLEVQNKQLWREGERVELTVQEYNIVAYLYTHAGKLCERQAIIENALNETYDPDDRRQTRLNTAMSRIINKVEPDPNNRRYLHTVHGRGYQLTC